MTLGAIGYLVVMLKMWFVDFDVFDLFDRIVLTMACVSAVLICLGFFDLDSEERIR